MAVIRNYQFKNNSCWNSLHLVRIFSPEANLDREMSGLCGCLKTFDLDKVSMLLKTYLVVRYFWRRRANFVWISSTLLLSSRSSMSGEKSSTRSIRTVSTPSWNCRVYYPSDKPALPQPSLLSAGLSWWTLAALPGLYWGTTERVAHTGQISLHIHYVHITQHQE